MTPERLFVAILLFESTSSAPSYPTRGTTARAAIPWTTAHWDLDEAEAADRFPALVEQVRIEQG